MANIEVFLPVLKPESHLVSLTREPANEGLVTSQIIAEAHTLTFS